jgi:dsDNA-binding SOS-regulon protein
MTASKVCTLPESIAYVRRHQEWRRGAETPQLCPKELGDHLDRVLDAADRLDRVCAGHLRSVEDGDGWEMTFLVTEEDHDAIMGKKENR